MAESEQATRRLIESHEFPFEFLSALAGHESWRKEINRPIYHVHKWWAKRLGSIFRGILLGSVLSEEADLERAFYELNDLADVRVFDPFMGSGTTVCEAHKLGMTALGRDINPVACESVRAALQPLDRDQLKRFYERLTSRVGGRIRALYRTKDDQERPCEVLYFFWVKQALCPECDACVDLFSNYMFARNAYPKKKPEVHVYCPVCSVVFQALHHQKAVQCPCCSSEFDPHEGPARGAKAVCTSCENRFAIAKAIRTSEDPPSHRLFAKLVLTPEGEKRYVSASEEDRAAYAECEQLLDAEIARGTLRLPSARLAEGYNTRQALNYNYRTWRDFFNARHLLALGWLHEEIAALPEGAERDALLLLFSGVLEFNNLFASYKGEGTGAVRHMFSHHVLKPERVPIEANVWGTPKSSGSFSGLFKSRLLRALDYRLAPFEVGLGRQKKIFGASKPIGKRPLGRWGAFEPGTVSLSCGTSDITGLQNQSIDLIVTDPPFFDNVHYSELADFFYAWQTLYPRGFIDHLETTTRHTSEVQDTDAEQFGNKLRCVFEECRRVLRDAGLLVFTYHHSRSDGWVALAEAIYGSGFSVVQAHPVKAELALATPKSQAKAPVLIDAILVCKKQKCDERSCVNPTEAAETALAVATTQLQRLAAAGHKATRGDTFVLMVAQFFVALGPIESGASARLAFSHQKERLLASAQELDAFVPSPQKSEPADPCEDIQYVLPL